MRRTRTGKRRSSYGDIQSRVGGKPSAVLLPEFVEKATGKIYRQLRSHTAFLRLIVKLSVLLSTAASG